MRIFAFSLLSVILLTHLALAQAEEGKESLRGIKGISVIVEDPRFDADPDLQEQLKVDVELRLRKAGITVGSEREILSFFPPWLHIQANTVTSNDQVAVTVVVQLLQTVYLFREPLDLSLTTLEIFTPEGVMSLLAATWSTSVTGIVQRNSLRAKAREWLADEVDQFINDYLAVNP